MSDREVIDEFFLSLRAISIEARAMNLDPLHPLAVQVANADSLIASLTDRKPRSVPPIPETTIVPPVNWREAGPEEDRRARLKSSLQIGGASLHLVAYAIHMETDDEDEDGNFRRYPMTTPVWELGNGGRIEFDAGASLLIDIGQLWTAHEMDGRCETVEIEGRHYAVFASPYCT